MISEKKAVLHYTLKFLLKEIKAFFNIFKVLSSCKNDLSRREKKGNDFRILDSVYKAGELLRLILNIFKIEGDDNFIQVDVFSNVIRTDNICYCYFRFFVGIYTGILERLHDYSKPIRKRFFITNAGQNNLS